MHYNNKVGVTRGVPVATANTVSLAPGEWITKIEGAYNVAIAMLSFVTNKGMQSGHQVRWPYLFLVFRNAMGAIWAGVTCSLIHVGRIWA